MARQTPGSRWSWAAALIVAAAAAVASGGDDASARRCTSRWSFVAEFPGVILHAVAAVARDDVWAVGELDRKSYMLHWNGHAWRQVSFGFPIATLDAPLLGTYAQSTHDVWVVGDRLIGQWTGKRWTRIRVEPVRNGTNHLTDLIATDDGTLWAVGSVGASGATEVTGPLVERWNGSRWSIAVSGDEGDGGLEAVDAASPTRAWAVGGNYNHGGWTQAYALRGRRWTKIGPLSSLGEGQDERGDHSSWFHGVVAVSARDVWVVGSTDNRPLIEHWDGSSWTEVPPFTTGALNAVTATSSRDVWAVGSRGGNAMTMHWDGKRWRRVSLPLVPHGLNGVDAVSTSDVWAVGDGVIVHYGC